MDKSIRRHEHCIIGLPRCDFVFSSTRSCFIGFGFKESALEMNVLRHLLNDRGIEAIEASGAIAPGQNAFCVKICSKVIASQFCIILLNNDENADIEIPNANVNMEYGLMLGFNKYVIPFQKESQKLPFNVAGLDTIKYSSDNFEAKATVAIDQAIEKTQQDDVDPIDTDQYINIFLTAKKTLIASVRSEGDKNIYELGSPFGFNLLTDFSGFGYIYFGNFTAYRPDTILWRLQLLSEVLKERFGNVPERVRLGMIPPEQVEAINALVEKMKIWVIVTSDSDRDIIRQSAAKYAIEVEVFSLNDVKTELEKLVP